MEQRRPDLQSLHDAASSQGIGLRHPRPGTCRGFGATLSRSASSKNPVVEVELRLWDDDRGRWQDADANDGRRTHSVASRFQALSGTRASPSLPNDDSSASGTFGRTSLRPRLAHAEVPAGRVCEIATVSVPIRRPTSRRRKSSASLPAFQPSELRSIGHRHRTNVETHWRAPGYLNRKSVRPVRPLD